MLKSSFMLVFSLAFICFSGKVSGQAGGKFAKLVKLEHYCGTEGGYVEFEILGDPDSYTYYWLHGPTTLSLKGLPAGIYTFVVVDFFGCVEEYTVEIMQVDGCEMTFEILADRDPCKAVIEIQIVNTGNSLPIEEQALDITWADGNPSGLTRIVSTAQSGLYCVHVELSGSDGGCCVIDHCFFIAQSPECDRVAEAPVIVNEYNRGSDGTSQYLELLVIGNGMCEDSFDLRGFLVDDNNGFLIQGNDFLTGYNLDEIGIDPGYLSFSMDSAWSAVPNGSLILIYDDRGPVSANIPPDDPMDDDQDGVYVLPASDQQLFYGFSGVWNEALMEQEYSGFWVLPGWELIQISAIADGMQVRFPDGEYCHGVSLGLSAFSSQNTFPLWINSNSSSYCNCSFMETDYFQKEHFSCIPTTYGIQTPGMANSLLNTAMIDSIRHCGDGAWGEGGSISLPPPTGQLGAASLLEGENDIHVYPNPFSSGFQVRYHSVVSGVAVLSLFSISGQELFNVEIPSERGLNGYSLSKSQVPMPPGILILQLNFPSGENKYVRIGSIN